MSAEVPHIVIVGAGFGGLRAAQMLGSERVRITVVDKRNHHLFQPLLYQVATAGLSPADIAIPIRSILRRQRNTEVLLAEVQGVHPEKNRVVTSRGELPYDYLVLATGSLYNYFGHEDWKPIAPGLKSIGDALAVREKILYAFELAEMEADPIRRGALMTFIVVGGGPTGVEMAGSIAELAHRALASDFRRIDPKAARVVLIEAGPRVLATFPPDLSERAMGALSRLGVEVLTQSRVEAVSPVGVVVNGKRIDATTVVWAAGVAATPVGKWLNAETDRAGRVVVQPDLTVAGHKNIFVIGDVAACKDEKGQPLPGIAPVAMQQGKFVASLILSRIAGSEEPAVFHYWDKGNLATVGRSFAVADLGKIKLSGWFAWVAWLAVHIYYLIGFRNRLLVVLQWAWGYVTFQRGARLITRMNGMLKKEDASG